MIAYMGVGVVDARGMGSLSALVMVTHSGDLWAQGVGGDGVGIEGMMA